MATGIPVAFARSLALETMQGEPLLIHLPLEPGPQGLIRDASRRQKGSAKSRCDPSAKISAESSRPATARSGTHAVTKSFVSSGLIRKSECLHETDQVRVG